MNIAVKIRASDMESWYALYHPLKIKTPEKGTGFGVQDDLFISSLNLIK